MQKVVMGICLCGFGMMGLIMLEGNAPEPGQNNTLAGDQDHERVIVLVVDLSGSYQQLMATDGHAYVYLQKVLNEYTRSGSRDRIVIVQISGGDPLILDATAAEVRRAFPTAESFRVFLLSKSNPGGASPVHDAITAGLTYVNNYPGIGTKCRCAVLCLTDLDENASAAGHEARLAQALLDYSKTNGLFGVYWAENHLVAPWQTKLQTAGIKRFAVYSKIMIAPPLPSFN